MLMLFTDNPSLRVQEVASVACLQTCRMQTLNVKAEDNTHALKKVLSIEIIISVPQISKDASTSLFLPVFKVIRSENDLFPYI